METQESEKKKVKSLCTSILNNSDNNYTGAGRVLCPAIPVRVKIAGCNKTISTYMGLDTFCSDVFMSRRLLEQLGVSVAQEIKTSLTTMCCNNKETTTFVVNNLEITDLDENINASIPVVYCKENWPFGIDDSPSEEDLNACPYLKHIPFSFLDKEIGLLVGVSQPHLFKILETVEGPEENSVYATRYPLGWALNGPINIGQRSSSCFFTKNFSNETNKIFTDFCAQEFLDVCGDETAPSVEEKEWEKLVKSTINKTDSGHFEVGLPFRQNNLQFPINRQQALQRLVSLRKRFLSDNDYFQEYKQFMDLMMEAGFAEEVPEDELVAREGKVWYLVHFGVYHKQKHKLRVVFDASLKYKGISLNNMLYQGPDLANNLLGVLLRFRQDKIAFSADIRKMFYQVRVKKEDRDWFFWFPSEDLNANPVEFRITVHVFGAVSSPSIANYVLQHIPATSEANCYSSQVKEIVKQNFYVDDLLVSTDSQDRAIRLLKEVTELVDLGKFKLVEVVSNSKQVLASVPPENLSKDMLNWQSDFEKLPEQRALGVKWTLGSNSLGFSFSSLENKSSKRGILSALHSIYDPLGLLVPVVVVAKRIFQLACAEDLGWDEDLSTDLLKEWNNWFQSVPILAEFRVARCYKTSFGVPDHIQLHVFCDGSELAYAAVAYLRFSYDNNKKAASSLVMAKSRLVPLKSTAMVTVPRIELNAARLAVNLSLVIKRELQFRVEKTIFWSDSSVVLKYIENKSARFQRFVANRISYIHAHSSVESWFHVPGELNPADVASRGCSATDLVSNKRWIFGAEFLRELEEYWPKLELVQSIKDDDPEVKKSKILATKIGKQKMATKNIVDEFLCLSSRWFQVKQRVAVLMRLQRKETLENELSSVEIENAELEICRFLQDKYFRETLECLKMGKDLPRQNSLRRLHPFLDKQNILRVGGRLDNAEVSYDVKHPILLPREHSVVCVLVRSVHHKVGHLGKETIISELRKKFWIVGIRILVKSIVRECIVCQKANARPLEPLMGELPKERVTADHPAFTFVGVDCFGPFVVKRGRAQEKRYGVIFTCLSSRAMHLEIVFNLSTDSFINAFRRFTARRGTINTVYSDNGTNFVGAVRELAESKDEWNDKQMQEWLKQEKINWKFNPPTASNFGGVWEREIRTIRKTLNAITHLQNLKLNDEELYTLMCEVEGILNSRPLTPVSDDPNDLEAITPNHLLLGNSKVTFPPGLFNKDDLYVKRRWRQIQYLADMFWKRWQKEYLPILQQRQKWTRDGESIQVGHLVLLMDQMLPRNQWSLGRIESVLKDKYNRVRVADVRVAKVKSNLKNGSSTLIRRPVSKLIPLIKSES